jgi:Kef-type K+ transport system membrane component KefB
MIHSLTSMTLLTGLLLLLSLLLRLSVPERFVPHFVLYLLIGIGLATLDREFAVFGPFVRDGLGFLAEIGIIILLFRVGMTSDIQGLREQLPRASWVWLGNVAISAVFGYVAARYLLGLDWLTSTVIAVALVATSVGVTVSIWEHEGLLKTRQGETLLDVAELDDLTSIILLTLLFALLPNIRGEGGFTLTALGAETAWILLKLALFVGALFVFSLKLEPRITRFLRARESPEELTVFVAATGIIIAGFAEMLGLSAAIGAFFAGLAMGRDDELVRRAVALPTLLNFFTPFFFIGVGLQMTASWADVFTVTTLVLLVAAILGKFIGAALPAYFTFGAMGAVCLGVSMIPRAEIALVVMQKALEQGFVSDAIFSSVVIVAAITTLMTPAILHQIFSRSRAARAVTDQP